MPLDVYYIADKVSALKPGMAITVSAVELKTIHPMPLVGVLGPLWHGVDQIMEKVIGSSYEIRVTNDLMTGNVTFFRLNESLKDGRRTWVSPDRRDLFRRDLMGYLVPIR